MYTLTSEIYSLMLSSTEKRKIKLYFYAPLQLYLGKQVTKGEGDKNIIQYVLILPHHNTI